MRTWLATIVAASLLACGPPTTTVTLEVTTTDGTLHSERVDYARGCPENPLTYGEIATKFAGLAMPAVGAARVEASRNLVERIESLDTIERLTEVLFAPTAP